MSHFQRMQYRVAPHYLHDYPHAPMGVHPVMPLMPVMAYGAPYGIIGDIQQAQRQHVSTAISAAKAAQGTKKFLTYTPTAPNEMLLAPTNTYGAGHKAAYWLAVAAQLGPHPALITTAEDIEAGTRSNEDANIFGLYKPGYSENSAKINEVLARAVKALDDANLRKVKLFAGVYSVLGQFSDPGRQASTEDVREQTGTGGSVTDKPIDPADGSLITPTEEADAPCEKTWKKYIPGYCEAEAAGELALLAAKIAGGVAVAGVAIWGINKMTRGGSPVRSNGPKLIANPSAEAQTDFGPENDIAKMPKAMEQERRLVQNVFKKASR